jgi:hypothetical protein
VHNALADLLYVAEASGYKWMVQAEDGSSRFASPVTYGSAPAGAVQMFPVGGGAPAALASGDMVYVLGSSGVSEDGYMIFASGKGTVP